MKWPSEKDSNTSRFSDILVFKRHCIYSSSNERNILTNRRYRKGVPSLSKIVYKITGYMKGCYWRSVFTISRFWPAPTTRVALPCHSWWNLLLLSWNLSSWALNTRHYILKGNCRVGHHFSGKPCKCFPYCDTTKKYILSDPFGSKIAIESVHFAAHSIFRH